MLLPSSGKKEAEVTPRKIITDLPNNTVSF
jgi:hypothetical protein